MTPPILVPTQGVNKEQVFTPAVGWALRREFPPSRLLLYSSNGPISPNRCWRLRGERQVGKVKASFWSRGDREGRRRWEPGEVRGTLPLGAPQGSSSPEARGEVKQRSGPQSWGAVPGEIWMLRSPYQPKSPQPSASTPASPILPSHKS